MEASDRTIVITDSSKLGANSLVKMCGIDRVSMVITDSHAPAERIKAFQEAGVNIVIANERKERENHVTERS